MTLMGGGGSRYRQFACGTFRLAYEKDSRLLFAAAFGGVNSQPDKLFYWDLGLSLGKRETGEPVILLPSGT